jgi:hypothetical protein
MERLRAVPLLGVKHHSNSDRIRWLLLSSFVTPVIKPVAMRMEMSITEVLTTTTTEVRTVVRRMTTEYYGIMKRHYLRASLEDLVIQVQRITKQGYDISLLTHARQLNEGSSQRFSLLCNGSLMQHRGSKSRHPKWKEH